MATLRPYKQLSRLSLASGLQGDRGLLPLYLAATLFELPPSAALSRATQPPTRLRGLGSTHSRPRTARRARGSARLCAPLEARAPRQAVCPGNHTPAPPRPCLSRMLRGVDGSRDGVLGAGTKAGSGLRLGNWVLGVSFPVLWAAGGAPSRFCGLSLSGDPECRRLWCPRASLTLRCHLPPRSAEMTAPIADTPRRVG